MEYTGGSVYAVKYKDGVLIATDTLVSRSTMKHSRMINRMATIGTHIVVTASGDHSDLQFIVDDLKAQWNKDSVLGKQFEKTPREYHASLTRKLYERRNKMKPLYCSVILGGVDSDGDRFLGYTDLYGTGLATEDFLATGFGHYAAMPHMRTEAHPDMSERAARDLLALCMSVAARADGRTSLMVQFAKITSAGATIEDPWMLPPPPTPLASRMPTIPVPAQS